MKRFCSARKWRALALLFGLAAPFAHGRGFVNNLATPVWIRLVLAAGDRAELMVEQVPPAKAAPVSLARESKEEAGSIISLAAAAAGIPEPESKAPAASARQLAQPIVTFLTLTREDAQAGGARFMVPPGGSLWVHGASGVEEPAGLEFQFSQQSALEEAQEVRLESAAGQQEAPQSMALTVQDSGEVSPEARLLGPVGPQAETQVIDVRGQAQQGGAGIGRRFQPPTGPGGASGIAVAYNTICCCAVL